MQGKNRSGRFDGGRDDRGKWPIVQSRSKVMEVDLVSVREVRARELYKCYSISVQIRQERG